MNHKDNRRVKMTKKILQKTLLEMLKEQSIHTISIRTLCERADLNRSTFYKYYGSQYDLLQEMEDELFIHADTELSNITPISCKQDTHDSLVKTLRFTEEHADLCNALLNANVDPEFPKKLLGLPSVYNALELATQNSSGEEAIYRQDLFFYGSYQIIKRWLSKEHRETPEEMANLLIQFIPFDPNK